MVPRDDDHDDLFLRAGRGEDDARQRLLCVHRDRLRRMVAGRIDRRLAARFDPSDVVQEALADAGRHLNEFLPDRPMAFYPWLRHFAWERLLELHRRHIQAQRRSIAREEGQGGAMVDESAAALADRLAGNETSARHGAPWPDNSIRNRRKVGRMAQQRKQPSCEAVSSRTTMMRSGQAGPWSVVGRTRVSILETGRGED
jgi:DNA-directed RNA polymerase specialized sigma24 family protein